MHIVVGNVFSMLSARILDGLCRLPVPSDCQVSNGDPTSTSNHRSAMLYANGLGVYLLLSKCVNFTCKYMGVIYVRIVSTFICKLHYRYVCIWYLHACMYIGTVYVYI